MAYHLFTSPLSPPAIQSPAPRPPSHPPHNPPIASQMVFEQFGFRTLFAAPAPWFSLNAACSGTVAPPNATARSAVAAGCGVVVDAGFSACNVVPFFNGQLLAGEWGGGQA